jgi:hypothetical protein
MNTKELKMNRLEIFQKVYGTDYVFTVRELEQLCQLSDLIIGECVRSVNCYEALNIFEHFGVDPEHFGVK